MKFLTFLILSLFIVASVGCFASCRGCTCQGTCQFPQNCAGVGPDCYCSGSYSNEDLIIKDMMDNICKYANNLTQPLIFSIQNQENTGFMVKCQDNQFMGYLV